MIPPPSSPEPGRSSPGPQGGVLVEQGLIYDWNGEASGGRWFGPNKTLLDETLRDGLQNASAIDPPLEIKLELLHEMDRLGIHRVNVGMPGVSPRTASDAVALVREIRRARLRIRPVAAGRTREDDLRAILQIAETFGHPVEAYTFIGSSPIRQYAESWDLDLLVRRSADAVEFAARQGLEVCFVTEDSTRSRPDTLAALFSVAVRSGAVRVCLSDTVGHATPDGVRRLVAFARETLASVGGTEAVGGTPVGVDWHGHNDRGLALVNALSALAHGADRVHATALGIGERVGNVPMELLILNLRLLGELSGQDTTSLIQYCDAAARGLQLDIPPRYPVVGRDAFRTTTGVHAAAIRKALARGQSYLADRVYSGVPAAWFGRTQEVCIGPMSGASNVLFWLEKRGITPVPKLVEAILAAAKASDRTLQDEAIHHIVAKHTR